MGGWVGVRRTPRISFLISFHMRSLASYSGSTRKTSSIYFCLREVGGWVGGCIDWLGRWVGGGWMSESFFLSSSSYLLLVDLVIQTHLKGDLILLLGYR